MRSIKEERLDRIVPIGVESVRRAVSSFISYYHIERKHQGLKNHLIEPPPCSAIRDGRVCRRERLGGMLSYYYRMAA